MFLNFAFHHFVHPARILHSWQPGAQIPITADERKRDRKCL